MSESTGPAQPAAPSDTTADSYAPPPDTQPSVSISDAARLLRNARRQQAAPGIGHNSGDPGPSGQSGPPDSANLRQSPPEGPPEGPPESAKPRGVAALEAALGLGAPEGADGAVHQEPPAAPMGGMVEIDGRQYSVDAIRAELSKAADYTHKTQQIAQQARELQAQQQALASFLPLIQPELEQLQRKLADAPRPDPALRHVDPAAYWDQWAQYQDAQAEGQRIMQMQQVQAQARDAAMQQAVQQAHEALAQKYPFWSDPQQRQEIQQDIVRWARTQGYTDQELQGLSNPRYLETLFKAHFYDKIVQGTHTRAPRPSVAASPPRGAAPPPAPAQAVLQAQEAFDAKPDWRNGAALIGARRAGNGRGNGHANW